MSGFVTRTSRPATSSVSACVGTAHRTVPWSPRGSDVIETDRLRLRPFADDLSDLDALHEIQSDAHHMRFYPHPFSREESRAWIERFLERQERYGYSLWAIEDRETGEFLGNCGPDARR